MGHSFEGGKVMSEYKRRKNPEDMKLIEQITATREDVCENICRYTEMKKHGRISADTYNEVCAECSVSRL